MTSPLTDALASLGAGRDLTVEQTSEAVRTIMAGEASEVEISAFLTGLKVKGETAEELTGAVRTVREHATHWDPTGLPSPLVDTCGTGGDGANTVNVSTATAIVLASCGVAVAKHGNRSASGNSGSAEVLQELGVNVEGQPESVRRCLADLGLTFLFAPNFHPALRFAGPVRRKLPFRTLFNLVGPLANPAKPSLQLVGVAGERQADLVAEALSRLVETERAAVVTGSDGLDEITLDGPTQVRWVESSTVTRQTWTRDDFGLPEVKANELRVSGALESAGLLRKLLAGNPGPTRSIVLANCAAALFVAGRVPSLKGGVDLASQAIDSGASASLLERWRELSHA
ncbi:anthranilate phosphoribosyltransferase [Singulisphaera sp. PoT]|uniref:anthranilate phosphoribosyltransferase n=1 Tax=Singulisphaera sp. PoT TaxID=3411797 RepID=UPI003BF53593